MAELCISVAAFISRLPLAFYCVACAKELNCGFALF